MHHDDSHPLPIVLGPPCPAHHLEHVCYGKVDISPAHTSRHSPPAACFGKVCLHRCHLRTHLHTALRTESLDCIFNLRSVGKKQVPWQGRHSSGSLHLLTQQKTSICTCDAVPPPYYNVLIIVLQPQRSHTDHTTIEPTPLHIIKLHTAFVNIWHRQ